MGWAVEEVVMTLVEQKDEERKGFVFADAGIERRSSTPEDRVGEWVEAKPYPMENEQGGGRGGGLRGSPQRRRSRTLNRKCHSMNKL